VRRNYEMQNVKFLVWLFDHRQHYGTLLKDGLDAELETQHQRDREQRAKAGRPGCEFIATNTDAVTHLTDAQEWAENGSMVGAIKGCTGQEPTVVGKPSPLMIDYLCDKLSLDRERICMVGD